MPPHVLDNAIHASLSGPHAHLAERRGSALRYPVAMSPLMALPHCPVTTDWADLAALAGHGAKVTLSRPVSEPPAGWQVDARIALLQFIDDGIAAAPYEHANHIRALIHTGRTATTAHLMWLTRHTRKGLWRKTAMRLVRVHTASSQQRKQRAAGRCGTRIRGPDLLS